MAATFSGIKVTGTIRLNTGSVPSLVTSGLIMNLDAGNLSSYPGTGTTWTDLTGNNNNATLVNGPTFSSANGGSIVFDGSNDYLRIPNNMMPSGTSDFTHSIWINITSLSNMFGELRGAGLLSGNGTGTLEWYIQSNSSSSTVPFLTTMKRYGIATTGGCSGTITMPLNTWHNIVLVRDGTASNKIYLNGSLVVTGDVSNSFNTTSLATMAGAPNAQSSFRAYLNGRIAQVGRYDRALNQQEISQNFSALRGRFNV